MKKKDIKIETIPKNEPFRVPDGYFEDIVVRIMSSLPERPVVENPKVASLWEKAKPGVYMAAMFAGIALMLNVLVKRPHNRQDNIPTHASGGLNLTSSNDIEDFFRYCEDELTKIVYDDAIADFLIDIEDGYLSKNLE